MTTGEANQPLHLAYHIDDEGALELARQLVDARLPDLSPEERYRRALSAVYSVKVLENAAADRADLAKSVDEVFQEGSDG